ncbi:fungal specific transcription factor domain containing protein [Grosmannia clavigera kw1407]|uniref:Fungal specific transcription factor domain containing protein n=1 Tax=Grosmannia clavigera (strain kw1407 / UAMH 11150) TaxID=655863 RepID=F0X7B0_GROCL|nr:fungal specific transcription factor domain containing protein [Grosmannia clavigera kw1407]EFX06499.1 fungal specific transcription factor domain containing protein [Grosmannia clavigera kw1407]
MVERHKDSSAVAGAAPVQRAAIACRSCRQRKVKCDAQPDRPDQSCGPCRRAGKDCMLDPMSDGRRSVNRKCVDRLQQRIEMLEAQSQRAADRVGWDSGEDSIHHHPVRPAAAEYTAMLLSQGPTYVHSANANPDTTALADIPPRSTQSTNTTDTVSQPSLPPPPARVEPAPTSSVSGSSPGANSSSHGSPSFYGATSHPHVGTSNEEAPMPMPLFDEADVAGIGIDLDPNSPHLRAHLFQSFFQYQTLWVDVVDKEAFLGQPTAGGGIGGANTQSRWRSSFLENAMLACGTRLSTSKSVRALGPKYCEWAKGDVLRAMSDPTPASLQGFLLLSEYEVTQGNDRPAWMYCGVACRMLSDLGLHELASLADGAGEDAEAEREDDLAYALLSACVVYEGVWTLYLGRPSSIPRAVMSVAAARCRQRRRADTPWLNAWVGLSVPMAEITRLLNERWCVAGDLDGDRLAALRRLSRQVDDWYEGLPPELAYVEDRLINMHLAGYGLHAQYCKVQILVRQALAQRQQPFTTTTTTTSTAASTMNPRKRPHAQMEEGGVGAATAGPDDASEAVAYQFALRIARLVVTYREAFGMEQIPSIMLDNSVVAATAMIRHHNGSSSSSSTEGAGELVWLRQLIKSMESVQPHFPIIARMLDSLKQICGSGPLLQLLPAARRGSSESRALDSLDFGAMNSRQNKNGSISNYYGGGRIDSTNDSSIGLGGGSDLMWDCFDAVITPSIFQSGAFVDSDLDLPPPSEALSSALAQVVS